VKLQLFKTNLMTHKIVLKNMKTPFFEHLKKPSNLDDMAIVFFSLSTCFVSFVLGYIYGLFWG